MRHFWILLIGLSLCCSAALAQEEPFKAKVNLVLEDGSIMLYSGSKKGVKTGDEFELQRNGVKVGVIKVTKTTDLASYAKMVSGDAKPMDVAVRVAAGKPEKAPPEEKAEKEPPKEKPKKDKDKDKEEDKDSKAKKKEKEDKPPKEDKPKEEEKAKAKPVEPPKPDKGEEPAALPPTALGLSGLMLMPSAHVDGLNKGAVAVYRNNADDESLNYTDTMLGFTYGVSKNVEVGYMNMTTSPEATGTVTAQDIKTNIMSLKYKFHEAAPAGKGRNQPSGMDYDYSLGLQYFSMSLPDSVSMGQSIKATRFFLAASGAMQQGTLHIALYTQGGSLFDRDEGDAYDGFGYQAGFEYPIGAPSAKSKGNIQERMSLILEYDDKPFFLGVQEAVSVGLRYRQENFAFTLGMLDVSESGILSLGGSYHF